jgi:hypothetical protein
MSLRHFHSIVIYRNPEKKAHSALSMGSATGSISSSGVHSGYEMKNAGLGWHTQRVMLATDLV